MLKRFFIIVLGAINFICLVYSQSLSVQSSIDKSEMLTGQQAMITVNIRTNDIAHTTYYLQKKENDYPRFRVLNTVSKDTVDVDNNITEFKLNILITSFDSTLITIPPIVVKTNSDSVVSNELSLKVIQPKVDISNPEKIYEEKGFWDVKITFKDYLYIIFNSIYFKVFALLFILIVIGLYLYHRYKKKLQRSRDQKTIIEVLSPFDKSKKEFVELDNRNLLQFNNYKEYYTECFDIIRRYLDESFSWNTMEMTGQEIYSLISEHPLLKDLNSDLYLLYQECDLVKFAKHIPLIHNVSIFRKNAESFIDKVQVLIDEYNEKVKKEEAR